MPDFGPEPILPRKPYNITSPVVHESSKYSRRYIREINPEDRPMPDEFSPTQMNMEDSPNPAYEDSDLVFEGLGDLDADVADVIKEQYDAIAPQAEQIATQVQTTLAQVKNPSITSLQDVRQAPPAPKTSPLLWIGLGLAAGTVLYMLLNPKGGKR